MNMSVSRFTAMVGERIQIARSEASITQKELADRLGFKDRQTLASIEAGTRKLSADELVLLMDALKKPMDWFTDPYRIVGEKVISWRAKRDSLQTEAHEAKARNLIAAFRRFHDILGVQLNPVLPNLELTRRNTFEDAWMAAEGLLNQWNLSDKPADQLLPLLARLNIHVLHVDTDVDVSGAACHLPQLNVILINRRESAWRRNFTAAHESFHLMTWNSLPPDVIDREYEDPKKAPRPEQIADNFASALLMPASALAKRWKSRGNTEIHKWILGIAREFGVSGSAMYYRLLNLEFITEPMAAEMAIDTAKLVRHESSDTPPLYSEEFVNALHQVLDQGRVSVRKAAGLLDCTIEDLEDLFTQYNMPVPFAL